MKKLALFLLILLVLAQAACSGGAAEPAEAVSAAPPAGTSGEESDRGADTGRGGEGNCPTISVEYADDDLDASLDSSGVSTIRLEGRTVRLEGDGARVEDNVVTIISAGAYQISGTLDDGQIVVDTEDDGTVRLILNGADISCSSSAPIYIVNATKTVITLADGTENRVTDGHAHVLEDPESDEPNAAIFSQDDLTINGGGSLTVQANYNNGIASKDDLKITGGEISVNAVHDGIKGKDSIAVKDGVITVNAGADGLQSHNDTDAEKGYIAIEGGTLDITTVLDGLQAETSVLISGGHLVITSGGGSASVPQHQGDNRGGWGNAPTEADSGDSAKGIKAGLDLTITGGSFEIDAADDALHSNDRLTIDGGEFTLSTGDDGLHADTSLTINGGELEVTQSYEGIESAEITINGGTIRIIASDDGLNASSGDAGGMGGRPGGPNEFSGDNRLNLRDGYVVVEAGGDGLDINGPIEMSGGTVIVNGPTNNGNGALDYAGAFNISGGFLVAVGSAGMAQAPSASSSQYALLMNLPSAQAAQTMVHIETQDGQEILTFVPTKTYQSIAFSSPELENGESYVVYSGGSSSGTSTDGLYRGGNYTAGTQVVEFTISSMVTGVGGYGGGFPGGFPGGRPGGHHGP